MTKAEWKSYIKNHLQKIDETSRYHHNVIEKTIDTIYSQMFSEEYLRNKKGIWKYVRDYEEYISTAVDFTYGMALDNTPVSLPRENGGLFKASLYVTSLSTAFTVTTQDATYTIPQSKMDINSSPLTVGDKVYVRFTSEATLNGFYTILVIDPAEFYETINKSYPGTSTAGTRHYGTETTLELTGRGMQKRDVDSAYDTIGIKGSRLCSYSGDKLFINSALTEYTILSYSILPKFSTLSDSDEVLLPVGAEEVLADRVLDTMRLIPPVDLMNDNADRYGTTQ